MDSKIKSVRKRGSSVQDKVDIVEEQRLPKITGQQFNYLLDALQITNKTSSFEPVQNYFSKNYLMSNRGGRRSPQLATKQDKTSSEVQTQTMLPVLFSPKNQQPFSIQQMQDSQYSQEQQFSTLQNETQRLVEKPQGPPNAQFFGNLGSARNSQPQVVIYQPQFQGIPSQFQAMPPTYKPPTLQKTKTPKAKETYETEQSEFVPYDEKLSDPEFNLYVDMTERYPDYFSLNNQAKHFKILDRLKRKNQKIKASLLSNKKTDAKPPKPEKSMPADFVQFRAVLNETLDQTKHWAAEQLKYTMNEVQLDIAYEKNQVVQRQWTKLEQLQKRIGMQLMTLSQNIDSVPEIFFHFCSKAFVQGTFSIDVDQLLELESNLLEKIIISNIANRFKPETGSDFKKLLRAKHEYFLIGNMFLLKVIVQELLNNKTSKRAMFPGILQTEMLYFELYSYTIIALLTDIYFEMFASQILELPDNQDLSDIQIKQLVFASLMPKNTPIRPGFNYQNMRFKDDEIRSKEEWQKLLELTRQLITYLVNRTYQVAQ